MPKFLSAESTNTHYGRFELIAELASGGMATVFLARLVGTAGFQRFVAIKRLHPHLAREPEFVEMFLDEARLAARIHHPHVVPIQEVGEADGAHYLVMDYIEGDTFARLLSRATAAGKRVPPGVSARVLVDALRGLHAAHELLDDQGEFLGLVHRDVSPQNIMVAVDGLAKITDFGVARANSRLTTTRTGQLKGKLAYMAPEQARGQLVDRRADIFAAGIVLWEALAMKRLFRGDGDAEVLSKILSQPIPDPRVFREDIPTGIVAVTMQALERDADARFEDAAQFADALEDAARAANAFATQREVAVLLTDVLGTELSAQRESVRGWLAGHESAPRFSDVPSVVTRIEHADGSGPRSSADGSSRRFVAITPSVHGINAPTAAASASGSLGAATVSLQSAPAPAPAQGRGNLAIFALAALVVLLAAGWGITTMRAKRSDTNTPRTGASVPAAPATEIPATAASVAPSVPLIVASSVAPVPSLSAAPSASVAPFRGTLRPDGKHHGTGLPDDMSTNPYR